MEQLYKAFAVNVVRFRLGKLKFLRFHLYQECPFKNFNDLDNKSPNFKPLKSKVTKLQTAKVKIFNYCKRYSKFYCLFSF